MGTGKAAHGIIVIVVLIQNALDLYGLSIFSIRYWNHVAIASSGLSSSLMASIQSISRASIDEILFDNYKCWIH